MIVLSYWTSLFAGLALPTEYGGDLLRVKDIWQRLDSGSTALASVLWSRLTGVGATFFVFGLIGLGRLERLAEISLMWVWAISVAMCVALAAVVFSRGIRAVAIRLLARIPGPDRLRNGALNVLSRMQTLATHRRYAWRIAALSLAAQLMMIVTNYLYAIALDLPIQLADMALVIPVVTLSGLLPVSTSFSRQGDGSARLG